MAKITRLPSGSWHAAPFDKIVDGVRKYASITAETKEEVKRQLAIFQLEHKKESKTTTMSLETAMNKYTEECINILSPSTLRGYDIIKRNHFLSLSKRPLDSISDTDIQAEVNKMAKKLSPKTIRNICGFLTAVYREYRPERKIVLKFPKKESPKIEIPTKEEMEKLLAGAEGYKIKLPVLICATFGMRTSEITGLRWENIDMKNKTIEVREAVVRGLHQWVKKAPKTTAGYRSLPMPEILYQALSKIPEEERTGSVVGMKGNSIYRGWTRLLKRCGVRHYRFYDIRHYYASVMYAIGIPEKYGAKRMGHAGTNMLHRVYVHIMDETENEHTDKLNEYFNKMQDEMQDG
jgi:integrase